MKGPYQPNPAIRTTNVSVNVWGNTSCQYNVRKFPIGCEFFGHTKEVNRNLAAGPQEGHGRKPHESTKSKLGPQSACLYPIAVLMLIPEYPSQTRAGLPR